MFMQGDRVRYIGAKFAGEMKNTFRGGEICSRILNQPGMYVVDFGDDSYVMPASSLEIFVPTKKELEQAAKAETEVTKRRKKQSEDEE